MGVHMAFEIHVDEAGQLQEARIHPAHRARIHGRHRLDQIVPEPFIRTLFSQFIGHGGGFSRINGRAHEGHRGRTRRIFILSHQRNRRQGRRARLTDRHHMGVVAQRRDHLAHIEHVITEIEASVIDRNLARIRPVGDVDLVIRQKGLDRAAQQGRVMARHGRHDQDGAVLEFCHLHAARLCERRPVALKMKQRTERFAPDGVGHDVHRLVIDQNRAQLPFGLAVIARQAFKQVRSGGRGAARQGVEGRMERRAQRLPGHIGGGAPGHHRRPAHFQKRVKHSHYPPRRGLDRAAALSAHRNYAGLFSKNC